MDGLLLIDKPSGWTSFDVVAKVRNVLRQARSDELGAMSKKKLMTHDSKLKASSPKVKVGHTGTLDPLATGLLVLVIGSYTKRAAEFSKLDKTYEATIKLGLTSTTGDEEGEKTAVSDRQPTEKEVNDVLKSFVGTISQIPPQFSAIKVNGQRAYKLARKGQKVELEPRKVKVYSIQLTDYSYPEVKFTADVSSGTYIRSLVEDIGAKLGTGAYMSALRRTNVGPFNLEDALDIEQLKSRMLDSLLT
jgi:tRNA pseudouridine55 synthase